MGRRRREDQVEEILERVRRAHEAAEPNEGGGGDRGDVDRLERGVGEGRSAGRATRVDPGRPPAAHAPGDADRLDTAPRPKVAPTRDTEKTLHRFRYPDRGADVPIDSGEGKSFEDPERTRTRIVTRRPRR